MRLVGRFLCIFSLVFGGFVQAVGPQPATPVAAPFVGSVEPILLAAARGAEWVSKINEGRAEGDRFAVGPVDLNTEISIEHPELYNANILAAKYAAWKNETPAAIVEALEGRAELSREPVRGLAKALGKLQALKIRAQRWKVFQPRLAELAARAANDVRGYHHLSRLRNREEKLRAFATLEESERSAIRLSLRRMCRNKNRVASLCGAGFDLRIDKAGDLNSLYEELAPASLSIFNAHFGIPKANRRSDIKKFIENGREIFELPFRDPQDEAVWRFVQENVEDEWRGEGWALRLKRIPVKDIGYVFGKPAYIEFRPGALPHAINGHSIILDANVPLTSGDAIATIRHEFGHVLGFQDCYLEFYDVEAKAIVNYQLDNKNIMCSKKGSVLPLHYQRLREAYAR